jgi:hypothetical protein
MLTPINEQNSISFHIKTSRSLWPLGKCFREDLLRGLFGAPPLPPLVCSGQGQTYDTYELSRVQLRASRNGGPQKLKMLGRQSTSMPILRKIIRIMVTDIQTTRTFIQS